jgi:hypothetical protein
LQKGCRYVIISTPESREEDHNGVAGGYCLNYQADCLRASCVTVDASVNSTGVHIACVRLITNPQNPNSLPYRSVTGRRFATIERDPDSGEGKNIILARRRSSKAQTVVASQEPAIP